MHGGSFRHKVSQPYLHDTRFINVKVLTPLRKCPAVLQEGHDVEEVAAVEHVKQREHLWVHVGVQGGQGYSGSVDAALLTSPC